MDVMLSDEVDDATLSTHERKDPKICFFTVGNGGFEGFLRVSEDVNLC